MDIREELDKKLSEIRITVATTKEIPEKEGRELLGIIERYNSLFLGD